MTDREYKERKDKEWAADKERNRSIFSKDIEAKIKYEEYYSKDPFPNIQPALLNSADIYNYVATTGMIFPFYPEKLSGASYEVTIGEKVIWWDEQKQEVHEEDLSKPGSYFKLEPNSIAFVMLEPTFRIPDYMALRFNLKIVHVYRGLLLGTGPLVDPGFVGKLSIPLHNLTANTYTFRHGDGLIQMEFTKLSPNEVWKNDDEGRPVIKDDLYKRKWIKKDRTIYEYISRSLEGSSDVMIRSAIPNNLKKVKDIAEKAQEEITEAKKELDQRVRNMQLITILSLVPVLTFACTAIYQLGSANTIKKEQIYELQMQYSELSQQYDQLQSDYDELVLKIERIEGVGDEDEKKD